MEFSPRPFDLLAWAESNGRVGIADVRTMFFSRQVVILDHNAEGMEKIRISDRHHRDTNDPRMPPPTNATSTSTTPDYLGLDFDRRQLRHLTREMQDRHQAPLTAEEMEVLHAHRFARRQRDAANAAREALAEATTVSRWVNSNLDGNDSRASAPAPVPASTSTLPAALQNFVNPDRAGAASFRNFINERNQDRERRSQVRQDTPPRASSGRLTQTLERLIASESTTPLNESRDSNDAASLLDRLSLASRQPPTISSSSWAAIEALYRTRYAEDPLPDRSARIRIELEEDDSQDFANRLRQPWRPRGDDSDLSFMNTPGLTALQRTALRTASRPGGTVETMGCCWSEDGRIL